MSPSIFFLNLLADLTPHGMLPLAYGIAAGGGTGLVPALAIMVLFAVLSWYGLMSYARAGEIVGIEIGGVSSVCRDRGGRHGQPPRKCNCGADTTLGTLHCYPHLLIHLFLFVPLPP